MDRDRTPPNANRPHLDRLRWTQAATRTPSQPKMLAPTRRQGSPRQMPETPYSQNSRSTPALGRGGTCAPSYPRAKGGRRERRRDARRTGKGGLRGRGRHRCCRILTAVRRWRIGRAALLGLVVQRDNAVTGELRARSAWQSSRAGSRAACGRSWGDSSSARMVALSMIGAALGGRSAPGADYGFDSRVSQESAST